MSSMTPFPAICPALIGLVSEFLTVPEASQLQPKLPSDTLLQRMDEVADLDEFERDIFWEDLLDDPLQTPLMFPVLVTVLPDDFPWPSLLKNCWYGDHLHELSWVLNRKMHLSTVKQWAESTFRLLASENINNTTNQRYVANQSMVWRRCALALINRHENPLEEWHRRLVQIAKSSAPKAWLQWLVEGSKYKLFPALGPDDYTNERLCRLVRIKSLSAWRKKQIFAMFTLPVDPAHYEPLVEDALVKADLEGCRDLYHKLGAVPSQDQNLRFLTRGSGEYPLHPDNYNHIRLFFHYMARSGSDRAAVDFCREWNVRQESDISAMATRRRAVEKSYKRKKSEIEADAKRQLAEAKASREEDLRLLDEEDRNRKRAATDEMVMLSRALRCRVQQ